MIINAENAYRNRISVIHVPMRQGYCQTVNVDLIFMMMEIVILNVFNVIVNVYFVEKIKIHVYNVLILIGTPHHANAG